MHRFANPTRFLKIARALQPWMITATIIAGAVGLYLALIASPIDYQQKDTVRIMYVHVPAAWMSLLGYSVVAGASAASIIWRHPLADVAARAAAPIGAVFTFICLVTGSLWGKPTWGTWWVWDARLTSVLVLLFIYIGYITLWSAFDDRGRAARVAAVFALVGAVNIPIIKFSVDWWNTLHQPASVFRKGGAAIDPSMLRPLLVMALAYLFFFIAALLMRMRADLAAQKLEVSAMRRAVREELMA